MRLLAISSTLLLLLPLGLGVAQPPAAEKQEPEKPRVDADGDPLPPMAIARLGTSRFRAEDGVNVVAFAPDGRVIASAGSIIRLWDRSSGKQIRKFDGPGGEVKSLTYCADGRLLAAIHVQSQSPLSKAVLTLYEVATGRRLSQLDLRGEWLTLRHVALSPDGKNIAARVDVETIAIQDIASGKIVSTFKAPGTIADALAYAPDGKLLAEANPKNVRLWDVATGLELRRLEEPAQVLAFSSDGKLVATGAERAARVYEVATGQELLKLELPPNKGEHWLSRVFFGAANKTLLTFSQYNVGRSWDLASAKSTELSFSHTGRGHALAPDGRVIAQGRGQAVEFWELDSGKQLQLQAGSAQNSRALAISADGRRLATVGHSLLVWDIATGQQLARHEASFPKVGFTRDGAEVVAQTGESTLKFWSAATGTEVRTLAKPGTQLRDFVCLGDGRTLAAFCLGYDRNQGKSDGPLCLLEASTGQELAQFTPEFRNICAVAIARDGTRIAAARPDGQIMIWDVVTRNVLQVLNSKERPWSLTFSPNSQLLAVADPQGIHLWNIEYGLRTVDDIPDIRQACFSPDGRLLLANNREARVAIWEVASGKLVFALEARGNWEAGPTFSPDGTVLITAGADTTTTCWDFAALSRHYLGIRDGAPAEDALETLWSQLASEDPIQGYRALWTLVAGPDQVVRLLKDRLQPEAVGPRELIGKLIDQLDADRATIRETAAVELIRLGALALPALKAKLQQNPSAELRSRIEKIVQASPARSSGNPLLTGSPRSLRAIQVLERIGTSDAAAVLKRLAMGTSEAPETWDARAALDRLERRMPSK